MLPGLWIAITLIASLLLVHFSVRSRPMPVRRPLNVDQGLPLPEVGQASTVFSLTALFGAYFGIYIILGIPALAGVAFGTVLGLFVIRRWILASRAKRFEDFLRSMLGGRSGGGDVFALVVSVAQLAYAASELLILREVSRVALGMRHEHATLLAVAAGIIGYFYVLFGGYMAVYRTDILQFVLVAAMAMAFGIYLLLAGFSTALSHSLMPRQGYWIPPLLGSLGHWDYIYHFVIGAIMGFGLFAAAPDAWKRVFVVTTLRQETMARFLIFVCVGVAPFVALLPLGFFMPPIPDGAIDARQLFSGIGSHDVLFIAASLSLIACFLSSFDSAVLASVHVGVMLQRKRNPLDNELPRFHWMIAGVLLSLFCLFFALLSFENPYLLGNLLLGPYAIIAGIQTGARAEPGSLPSNSVLWIVVLGFFAWFVYFVSAVGFPTKPTTYEVNTVPGGALIFLIIALICWALRRAGNRHA